MKVAEVREKYLKFMESKGHAIVPSSRLIPENDPTTLFTGSGMQPMIQYLLGQPHPKGTRVADSQRCFRAEDIEEVGDNRHTTFFEMLGNWSFGDYFKEEQIDWMWEFLTSKEVGLGLPPEKLYITCFGGDEVSNTPKDAVAPSVWQKRFAEAGITAGVAEMGSEAEGAERGMQDGERIFYYNAKKNWWSRAGVPANMPVGEPGGPDSEMFYDFATPHDKKYGAHCHPNCDCGRFIEIGNNVFMQYLKTDAGFKELEHKNIDFGGGLERLTAATVGNPDVFMVDVFKDRIDTLASLSGKSYSDPAYQPSFRIIADHLRAAEAMISEEILPSNTEQGYFTRRLIRRSVIHADKLGVPAGKLSSNAVIQEEEARFRETLARGMKQFEHLSSGGISGNEAFILFTTYGFPIELTQELAKERGLLVDMDAFKMEMEKHREQSRAGSEHKFKGGLADHSAITTAYHTATHLMLAGLRKYVGPHVHQKGSNITGERTRFDVNHDAKIERDVLDNVEQYVNDAITAEADMVTVEMPKEEAKAQGVEGSFWEKYPDTVKVWTITDGNGTVWSKELCGGPHVGNTREIGEFGTFKIVKEESSSAGVRRIKAVLQK